MSKTKQIMADISALLRARNPLLWVTTREEARAEQAIFEACASAGYITRTWDVAQGFTEISGKVCQPIPDPRDALDYLKSRVTEGAPERGAWIMRDLDKWLRDLPGATCNRALRNLSRLLPSVPKDRAQAIIILTTSSEIPPELAGHVTLVDWPLPDREEIAAILDSAIAGLPASFLGLPDNATESQLADGRKAFLNGSREAAIDAAVGLTGEEAASTYAKSLVSLRKIDPAAVAKEKKRVISKDKLLEWIDPLPDGMDAVGGLDILKGWLRTRRNAYTKAARDYGLPSPKGLLLVGVPGCGKSLTAKACATSWQVPLLKLDLGALKSKYVGESEANLRRAFSVIESVGRCVVWLDELEKSLAGATDGSADGGVSSDALGAVLGWMQDRSGEAFVVATCNSIAKLPPELLRKGRFDEIFFVDLPTMRERCEIITSSLKAHNRALPRGQIEEVACATDQFTGAELAALVPEALFTSFADNARDLTQWDLIAAAGNTVPLAVTAPERIKALRDSVKSRARPATTPEVIKEAPKLRAIDI